MGEGFAFWEEPREVRVGAEAAGADAKGHTMLQRDQQGRLGEPAAAVKSHHGIEASHPRQDPCRSLLVECCGVVAGPEQAGGVAHLDPRDGFEACL